LHHDCAFQSSFYTKPVRTATALTSVGPYNVLMFTKLRIETPSFEFNDIHRNVIAVLKDLTESFSWHGRNVV
jgi:hypothetical protein